jgi:DUF917 family protein
MAVNHFGIADLYSVAAGAAVLGSGGGGSYTDALRVLDQLTASWNGTVTVQDYDGATNCCVLAMIGSPDKADNLKLADILNSITNTFMALPTDAQIGCVIPVEIGPINSLVPLIAAATCNLWVVDGDGAGRAVPMLPQTTFSAAANLPAAPCFLGNNAQASHEVQSALLRAGDAAKLETLAGSILSTPGFGNFAGIALWLSNARNGYALSGSYLPGTLAQAWALGNFLTSAPTPPLTNAVAAQITALTGRTATPVITNFYITAVTQATSSASLDAGIIRLGNAPNQADSTETHYLYNLNENLIMYSSLSNVPDIIAPDSICYYSEATGRGFSNATDDLAVYFDPAAGSSTGKAVSIIKIQTAPQLYQAPGVVASFAGLLQKIGYAGAMPAN